MKQNGYGPEHRAAKTKKLESMPTQKCEITGKIGEIDMHHSQPKLFNGPDDKDNYIALERHFHQKVLHALANVEDKKLVGERVKLTHTIKKYILDDLVVAQSKEKIDKIDDILVNEYIDNILNKMPFEYRDKTIRAMLIASFKVCRNQMIEILQLKAKLNAVE